MPELTEAVSDLTAFAKLNKQWGKRTRAECLEVAIGMLERQDVATLARLAHVSRVRGLLQQADVLDFAVDFTKERIGGSG